MLLKAPYWAFSISTYFVFYLGLGADSDKTANSAIQGHCPVASCHHACHPPPNSDVAVNILPFGHSAFLSSCLVDVSLSTICRLFFTCNFPHVQKNLQIQMLCNYYPSLVLHFPSVRLTNPHHQANSLSYIVFILCGFLPGKLLGKHLLHLKTL